LRVQLLLGLVLILSACSNRPVTVDINWEEKTITAIKSYIVKPGNEELAESTKRFLDDPIVGIDDARDNLPWVEAIKQYSDTSSIKDIEWEKTVIGTLQCGIGGGYYISVVFNKDNGEKLLVTIVPGE